VLKGFQHRHPKKIKRKMFVFCPSFLKGLYKLPLPKKNVRLNVRHCQALFEPLDPWNNRRAREIPGNLKKIKTKKNKIKQTPGKPWHPDAFAACSRAWIHTSGGYGFKLGTKKIGELLHFDTKNDQNLRSPAS
jgi:hypothetical protein